jgi:hypothetical protein
LYGTSNECRETIQLRIYTSEYHRDLSRDWHLADKEIIRVEMSPSQFAEMITSLNVGSGTPVTIRRLQGEGIEEPPYKNDRDLFDHEFKTKVDEVMDCMNQLIDETESIGTQKAISKKDVSHLLNRLKGIRQEIQSNMPFVAQSFSEHMGNVVSSAKIEFESFVEGKIRSVGLETLREEAPKNPLLENGDQHNPQRLPLEDERDQFS